MEYDIRAVLSGIRPVGKIVKQPAVATLTDEDFVAFPRNAGVSNLHLASSCAMGTGPGIVVDPRLRVYGIERLHVADASIMTVAVGGNTNARSIMIGEKPSAMLLEGAARSRLTYRGRDGTFGRARGYRLWSVSRRRWMSILRAAIIAAFVTLGFGIGASAPAKADQMTWTLTSKYKYKVQVAFYSKTRNHLWPANGEAWGLDDYGTHRFTLSCVAGEKICYGAWATGDSSTYWGVGFGGKQGCSTCCAICGEEDPNKTLTQ